MVEGFIQMISELVEQKQWTLDTSHRCDVCNSQAYVQTLGVTGDLLFCVHHYDNIMRNEKAQEAMTQFAYQVIDEREQLDS